jgi:hypothetical protein
MDDRLPVQSRGVLDVDVSERAEIFGPSVAKVIPARLQHEAVIAQATGRLGCASVPHAWRSRPDFRSRVVAMLRFDPGLGRLGDFADGFVGACRMARMARFGVRSGSLERSLREVIPHIEAV